MKKVIENHMKGEPDKIVGYCDLCAMKYKLPVGISVEGNNSMAGYCLLCGECGIYVGSLPLKELFKRMPEDE